MHPTVVPLWLAVVCKEAETEQRSSEEPTANKSRLRRSTLDAQLLFLSLSLSVLVSALPLPTPSNLP